MPININSNLTSIRIQRSLYSSSNSLNNSTMKLSSGIKINSAKDNAANLALSKKLSYKASGLNVANKNIQTGISKLQTFDGYLGRLLDNLHKSRDLAVQSANGVYSNDERNALQQLSEEYQKEISIIAKESNDTIDGGETFGLINKVKSMNEAEASLNGYDSDHKIYNAEDFVNKITGNESEDFILMTDIDMSSLGTLSESVITNTFSGNLEGNGYKIKGLTIDTEGAAINNVGLFSEIDAGKVQNLSMENIEIIAKNSDQVGSIAGSLMPFSEIENSYSNSNIKANNSAGSLVGYARRSTIKNSYTKGNISVENSNGGGLIGEVSTFSSIENSHSYADIKGSDHLGGLIGRIADSSSIKTSYAKGNISATGPYVGGLVGYQRASGIEKCYATGNVSGSGLGYGGLVGFSRNTTIKESFATGSINSSSESGGLVGRLLSADIENSYATGSAKSNDISGGLVGALYTDTTVTNSYSSGKVTASSNAGGLIGKVFDNGVADNSNFWNKTTSNQVSSASNAIGLANSEITPEQDPIKNLDSSIWNTSGSSITLKNVKEDIPPIVIQTTERSQEDSFFEIEGLNINLDSLQIDLTSAQGSRNSIELIDTAIENITDKLSKAGSSISRLESILNSNSTRKHNLQSSNSTIQDTDMAAESANILKQNILQQSSIKLLQQTQQMSSQSILGLLVF